MIRKITLNDITKINDIGTQLYSNFNTIYKVDNYINNPMYSLYLIEEEEIIGFLIATDNLDVYELQCIIIDEKYRKKGYGTKIMNYFINSISKSIILEVSDKNINALSLYKDLGFIQIGFREKYYGNSNAIIMKLVK